MFQRRQTHDGGSELDRLEAMDEQAKGQSPTIISKKKRMEGIRRT